MARFDDKVVVVTGGGLGFGRAYSLGLAAEGATVVIADINMENAMQTQAAIEELGGKAVVIHTDVSDEASVLAMRDQVDRELGGIDGLVNNAGIYPVVSIDDVTKEHWDQIYNVNVWGSFVTARAVAESMKRRGGGSIVNISSGTFLRPPPNQPAYVSSKGAIIALTRSLATELANDGIRVNTVLPGLTATPGIMGSPRFLGRVHAESCRPAAHQEAGAGQRYGWGCHVPPQRRLLLRHRPVDAGQRWRQHDLESAQTRATGGMRWDDWMAR